MSHEDKKIDVNADEKKGLGASEATPLIKEKEEPQPVAMKELYRYATTFDKVLMAVGLAMSIIAGAAFPLTTVVFGNVVNAFTSFMTRCPTDPGAIRFPGCIVYTGDQLMETIAYYTLYFVYLAIAVFFATYIYMASWVYTGEKITHRVREQYIKAVLRQDLTYFDFSGAGEVATRISSDTLLIQDGISEKVPLLFSQLGTFFSAFVIAFFKSWKLTLVLMCVIPLIAITGFVMNLINGGFQTQILNQYSKAGTLAEEALTAVRIIYSLNAQTRTSFRYNERLGGARNAGIKKSIVLGVGTGSLFFWIYCSYALAFWFGSRLLNWGLTDSGSITTVFFAVLIGSFSLGQVAPDLQAISLARSAGGKVFYTIDRVPKIDPYDKSGTKLRDVKGKIELKNIKFIYPARPELTVLADFSLMIEPGTTVALVGASGSGKSTIIQLIERFYDPISGTVFVDDIPMPSINLSSLRHSIGYVQQEPVLFEGSIFQNIAHGLIGSSNEHATLEEKRELVKQAAIKANAHDFIMKLPGMYDNPVGERGQLLSGGQKQRICIARAIVKNPMILLLDEATSALDTNSERVVQDALDRAAIGRTTVVIAHRLSTIRNAHKIVVMARGEIVETGTHDSLLSIENGAYVRLVEAQQLAAEEAKKKEAALPKKDPSEEDPDYIPPMVSHLSLSRKNSSVKSSLHKIGDDEKGAGDDGMTTGAVIAEIYNINKPELKYTIPGLIAAIVAGCVSPAFAVIFAKILGVFTETGDALLNDSNFWSGMFVVIAVVAAVSNVLQSTMFGLAAELLTERIRCLTFKAIMRQDVAFFDDERHATGILTSNLNLDAQAVQGASGVTLGTIFQVVGTLTGGTVIALIYSWKLALVALVSLPLLILAGAFRIQVLTYFSEKAKRSYERSAQLACEAVAAIRTVQSLTRENDVHDIYLKMLEGPLKDGVKNAYLNTLLYALSQSVNFAANALVFWYGGRLIAYEGLSLSSMFTVFMAIIFGSTSAGRVFATTPDLNRAKSSGEAIIKLLRQMPFIDSESLKGDKPESIQGRVEFRKVHFKYPTRPNVPVLRGLNLKIDPGQFVALVGASGCGKSTTIGLLERFYDPSSGEVLIDGKNLKDLNVAHYRSFVGLVSQEPMLFDMTVKENIIYGLSSVPTQEQVEAAAKAANIHDFIMSLPNTYNTSVGSKGSQLSGGQKQRIAIARALIRQPKILLLDEATSALDAESEKVVQTALDNAAKGRTTISIAHRLSTIQNADVIYVFKDGVVAESGSHQELLQLKGLYHELAIQQNLDSDHPTRLPVLEHYSWCLRGKTQQVQFSKLVCLKGFQLSGGQKQCIAIARALIRQLWILLLDEATRQLIGSSTTAVATAKLLTKIVQGGRWSSAESLINILREHGDRIQKAAPMEFAVGNIVRRLIFVIREEEENFLSEGDGALDHSEFKGSILEAIKELLDEIMSSKNVAEQALEHIHSGEIIMTVGHSATVERFLKEAGRVRKFQVIVAESAPSYKGQRMALALSQVGIDTTLITDSAVFALMPRVNKVIIGAHAVMSNGGLVAISGTGAVAAAARHYAKPVVVCTGLYKLSYQYPFDPESYSILAAPDSVHSFQEGDIVDKVDVLNPVFEYVKPDLISLFVTNIGPHPPNYMYILVAEQYGTDA
ncbi:S-methyl-5-thioribose-1-phosphate isomerase [Synchytrium microbalum]|uniref:S-methyl-5-thioribose-1-phosphate isomerase n=1 Tax=Synchytrium microbalum TaxID=1806994 RepID=A0A507C9L9_9FUNG|nr:S-methyl-5-thioribose-1-phosphate isomerase [Synchytrium microbalum]TPX38280.1 S-methyl-5-thioribose-1-phosphate isomerase [Synchytrium microbalum]